MYPVMLWNGDWTLLDISSSLIHNEVSFAVLLCLHFLPWCTHCYRSKAERLTNHGLEIPKPSVKNKPFLSILLKWWKTNLPARGWILIHATGWKYWSMHLDGKLILIHVHWWKTNTDLRTWKISICLGGLSFLQHFTAFTVHDFLLYKTYFYIWFLCYCVWNYLLTSYLYCL